jgi:PPOX class probable F420-dependent enzyme
VVTVARSMSTDEWHDFVLATPPRTAKLAVVRADGSPFAAPIWVDLDHDDLVFTTGRDTVKGKAIRRDPRVCLTFDDDRPPFSFVIVEGTATVSDDLDELLVWATRIAGRYMGVDRGAEYGRRNAVPEEMLVRVKPAHVVAQAGISD